MFYDVYHIYGDFLSNVRELFLEGKRPGSHNRG